MDPLALLRRLNRPRVYTARSGPGRGLKQVGGVRLLLPPRFGEREDAEELAFWRGLDLTGKLVWDVGAFEGIVSMFFARKVGAGGHVVAFEPHPQTVVKLRRHLELNRIENVEVRAVGVGAHEGELELVAPAGGGQATGVGDLAERLGMHGEVQRFRVPVRTLDQETGERPPDFVKVDVEGMEADVLTGAARLLREHRPDLYIEMHGVDEAAKIDNARRVVGVLIESGYSVWHVESRQDVTAAAPERGKSGHLYCRPA